MVVLFLALLLGGTFGFLYLRVGEKDLPQPAPTLGGTELASAGYDWSVPILGGVVNRQLQQPTNLTVQKLQAEAGSTPMLLLPDWTVRSEAVLTGPDGKVAFQGDGAAFNTHTYTQNGKYDLLLTLYGGDNTPPAEPKGWYRYHVGYNVNLQPKVQLSTAKAAQGSVVALELTALLEDATPTLETDLGRVWFCRTSRGWMGYIPVTYNAESGVHTMVLTCGSLSQEIELTVLQKAQSFFEQGEQPPEPAGAGTAYQNAIWPLYNAALENKQWSGTFFPPVTEGNVLIPYGTILNENGKRAGINTGLTYQTRPDAAVMAPAAGKIVYAGELALTGGTVVIDHGCGLKSYLFGLNEVTAANGAMVAKGEPVGTTGQAHALIWELRIGSKSVDPAQAVAGTGGLQFHEAG